jgi:hypothetical protein
MKWGSVNRKIVRRAKIWFDRRCEDRRFFTMSTGPCDVDSSYPAFQLPENMGHDSLFVQKQMTPWSESSKQNDSKCVSISQLRDKTSHQRMIWRQFAFLLFRPSSPRRFWRHFDPGVHQKVRRWIDTSTSSPIHHDMRPISEMIKNWGKFQDTPNPDSDRVLRWKHWLHSMGALVSHVHEINHVT